MAEANHFHSENRLPKILQIIETPRDGMQGVKEIIPIEKKVEYINILLQCGFDTVEVGSFVSPRAIPQMADTPSVLEALDYSCTKSKIAVLVGNLKGGTKAVEFAQIDQLFYPFSISTTFLRKNLNTTIEEAEETVDSLQNLCLKKNKELVVFLSLAFGDPFGDMWSIDLVHQQIEKLSDKGIKKIPFAETIGNIGQERIFEVFDKILPYFPQIEFGFHTHAIPEMGIAKVDAAYRAGIRRFDTVLGGLGGCPMTGKKMIGNLNLTDLLKYCSLHHIETGLDLKKIEQASKFQLL